MWHVSKSYFKSSIDVNYKGALLINLIKVWQKATFRSKSCFEINNFEFYHFWHEKFKHSRLLTSKIPKFWLFWKENYEDSPIMIFRNFEQQAVNCVSGWHREIRRGIPFWITFESRLNRVWITFESFESSLNNEQFPYETLLKIYESCLNPFELLWITLNHIWITSNFPLKHVWKSKNHIWITFELRLDHVWITFESRLNHDLPR